MRSRIIGFRGELEFNTYLRAKGSKIYNGGMFVPNVVGSPALASTIYFTIIHETTDLQEYIEIYEKIDALKPISSFIITYNSKDEWNEFIKDKNILLPKFTFYRFEKSKFVVSSIKEFFSLYTLRPNPYNYKEIDPKFLQQFKELLAPYSEEDLLQIYIERLFFDVYLARRHEIGIPSDIDIINLKDQKGVIHFGEVKEKDLAKSIKGFGLDIHRMKDLNTISEITETPYYLIVRHVNNQKDREFVDWQVISIQDFIKNTNHKEIEGGTGMRSKSSKNPTKICPIEFFIKL